jgi:hypothetical protein
MLCQSVIARSIIGMRLYVAHFVAQQFLGDSNSAPNKVYNVELASQDVDFKRKKYMQKQTLQLSNKHRSPLHVQRDRLSSLLVEKRIH